MLRVLTRLTALLLAMLTAQTASAQNGSVTLDRIADDYEEEVDNAVAALKSRRWVRPVVWLVGGPM